jgi:thiamine kinase-like enzyme
MAQRYVASVSGLQEILQRLEPSLGPLSGEPVPLSGGITNHNFRAELGGQEYVVRVHGKDTDALGIDRRAERLASETAAALQIAPELLAAHEDCLVTRFIPSDPLDAHEIAARAEEIARALRAFHDSPAALPTRFWVPHLLEEYAAQIHARGVRPPDPYGRAAAVAARIADALAPWQARPCHNDLLPSNIIRARDRDGLLIVDWEYAGMGHPYFDLGNLSVNNDFDEAADERLLSAYHGEPPSDARRATLALMRILSDAREAAWGVVQAQVSELDFDFDRYARMHFERLRDAVARAQLEEWLAAAGAEGAVGAVGDAITQEGRDGQAA